MHCLYGLQELGFAFALKGGTSLSKGHQIINRFSEDIGLPLSPEFLELPEAGESRNTPTSG